MTSTKTCRTCGQPRGQGSGRGVQALLQRRPQTRRDHHALTHPPPARRDDSALRRAGRARAEHSRDRRATWHQARLAEFCAGTCRLRARPSPACVADRIVDEVAIRRCLAGTLDGRRLTDVEREQAVLRLWRRSATPADIARRVGVSVVSVLPTVERHSPSSGATGGALVRATPGTVTCDQAERARHTMAAAATDTADARELLVALGLVAKQPAQGESAA